MKHTVVIEVPATTKEITQSTTCDFCGKVIPPRGYEFEEVTIMSDKGNRYPEGGYGKRTIFDCCATCWEARVLPALHSMGAKSRIEEWDF